jgi:MHS family proline/betaine transporter-like MFS transporter
VFLSSYAIQRLALPARDVFAVGFITACLQAVAVPIFGLLSDRCRRTTIPLAAAALALGGVYPMFSWLVANPTFIKLIIVQILFGLLVAAYAAPLPALLSELFPANVRTTGLSLTYSITVAIFGGFAPLIETWISRHLYDKASPFLYVVAAALVSWVSAFIAARVFLTEPFLLSSNATPNSAE